MTPRSRLEQQAVDLVLSAVRDRRHLHVTIEFNPTTTRAHGTLQVEERPKRGRPWTRQRSYPIAAREPVRVIRELDACRIAESLEDGSRSVVLPLGLFRSVRALVARVLEAKETRS